MSYQRGRSRSQGWSPTKDPSDALQAKEPDAIRKAIWDAKPYSTRRDSRWKEFITTSYHTYRSHMIMSIHSKDLIRNYTGSGMGNLQPLLVALGQERPVSCVYLATDLLNKGESVWDLGT